MKYKVALFAACALALPAAAVDSTLLNLIGPDAAIVSGVDFDRVRESPFGQYLLRQLNMSEEQVSKMAEHLGFDPRRDLREVLAAMPITAATNKHGLVLVRGAFDQSKLTGLAGLAGLPMSSYQGVTMFSPKRPQDPWAAIMPGGLAIGDEATLKAAVDRAASNPKPDAALVSRIQAASTRYDAWMLTTVSPSRFAPQLKGRQAPGPAQGAQMDALLKGELVQGIEAMSVGVKFGANVILSGEAQMRSEKDADALGDVMKFLVGMAASGGASFLNSLQTAAEGRTLKFSLSAPQSDFERMMEPRARMRARPVSR